MNKRSSNYYAPLVKATVFCIHSNCLDVLGCVFLGLYSLEKCLKLNIAVQKLDQEIST